ncbi:MAG: hypothetical protein ABI388_03825 [Bacteroidia bacterium]
MKTLESIKQYSPCQCESGGMSRALNNGGIIIPPRPVERPTGGGTINDPAHGGSHAYSHDDIKLDGTVTFYFL